MCVHSRPPRTPASNKTGALCKVGSATKKGTEMQFLKGTVHLRGRNEAPWNFKKNPLGVTKVLTIPWEFINKMYLDLKKKKKQKQIIRPL